MIRATFLDNDKRRPVQVRRLPRKARLAGVSLTESYTTHHPEGDIRVSGGRHFLTDIAAETLPDLEKPVLWWRHREEETKPARARW
jgi:hypothetical protein